MNYAGYGQLPGGYEIPEFPGDLPDPGGFLPGGLPGFPAPGGDSPIPGGALPGGLPGGVEPPPGGLQIPGGAPLGDKVTCQQGVCYASQEVYDKSLTKKSQMGLAIGGVVGLIAGAALMHFRMKG